MGKLTISVASDFSQTPGSRYISEGDYSGEEFRKKILETKFDEAIETNQKLIIDLDGTFGYGTSFLEEAFGGLARIYGDLVMERIELISLEEPYLIDDIKKYIKDASKRG